MCDMPSTPQSSCCARGRMDRFMEPCILLLLSDQASHGYELMDRLSEFGLDRDEIAGPTLYRALRRMEDSGHVVSEWEEGGQGPARRKYTLTDAGRAALQGWVDTVRERVRRLELFIEGYEKRRNQM